MYYFGLRILVILTTVFCVTKSTELIHNANTTIADAIAQRVRVVCGVVMTGELSKKETITKSVQETWGKRCNKLMFLNNENEASISSMLPMRRDQHYFHRMSEADADWYLLTNTKGYILVENLRYMLFEYDSYDEIYSMLVVSENKGVSYILSKKAMEKFMKIDVHRNVCNTSIDDDVARENCFRSIGLKTINSQDFLQRDRYIPGNPYLNKEARKFWDCRNLPERPRSCFSDYAVSFDDVSTQMKYVVDYLIYQLRPYGINFGTKFPSVMRENTQTTVVMAQSTSTSDEEDVGLLLPVDGNVIYD